MFTFIKICILTLFFSTTLRASNIEEEPSIFSSLASYAMPFLSYANATSGSGKTISTAGKEALKHLEKVEKEKSKNEFRQQPIQTSNNPRNILSTKQSKVVAPTNAPSKSTPVTSIVAAAPALNLKEKASFNSEIPSGPKKIPRKRNKANKGDNNPILESIKEEEPNVEFSSELQLEDSNGVPASEATHVPSVPKGIISDLQTTTNNDLNDEIGDESLSPDYAERLHGDAAEFYTLFDEEAMKWNKIIADYNKEKHVKIQTLSNECTRLLTEMDSEFKSALTESRDDPVIQLLYKNLAVEKELFAQGCTEYKPINDYIEKNHLLYEENMESFWYFLKDIPKIDILKSSLLDIESRLSLMSTSLLEHKRTHSMLDLQAKLVNDIKLILQNYKSKHVQYTKEADILIKNFIELIKSFEKYAHGHNHAILNIHPIDNNSKNAYNYLLAANKVVNHFQTLVFESNFQLATIRQSLNSCIQH